MATRESETDLLFPLPTIKPSKGLFAQSSSNQSSSNQHRQDSKENKNKQLSKELSDLLRGASHVLFNQSEILYHSSSSSSSTSSSSSCLITEKQTKSACLSSIATLNHIDETMLKFASIQFYDQQMMQSMKEISNILSELLISDKDKDSLLLKDLKQKENIISEQSKTIESLKKEIETLKQNKESNQKENERLKQENTHLRNQVYSYPITSTPYSNQQQQQQPTTYAAVVSYVQPYPAAFSYKHTN